MQSEPPVQLYGGFLARSPQDQAPASVMAVESKPKRAVRKKNPKDRDDSSNTRQRGRPRLDTRDQTAAERRRTQIRLAQRAYRERKETTISALEKRANMLEHTINEMNRTFLRFNDQAMASDICGYKPVLGEALRVAVEHFLELAQTLSPEPDPEDDGPVRIEHTPDFLSGNSPDQNTSHSPEILQNHSVPLIPQKPANPAPADMWGYSLINDTRSDPGRGNDDGNEFVLGKDYSTGRELDSDRHNSLAEERLKLDFPGPAALFPSPANSIKSPYTYSFQESTFARRLLRSCLERTYHLMTSPNRSQQEIDRIFRFSFCWGTDKDIIKGLRTLLTRTSKEPLELWNAPRLHLGGSGLHFPRGGLDGDSPAPELWWAKQPIGPNKLRLGTSLTSSSIDGDPTSELDDMEGEWYDPNDVEQYLRTKGLFLDGHSSLADVEVDVSLPPLAVDTSSGSGSSPVSGQDPVSPATDSDALSIAYTRERDSYLSTSNIDLSDVSDANFDSMDGLDFSSVWTSDMDLKALQNFGDSQITTINNLSVHQPMVSTTRRLTVDVNKFIEELQKEGVCLGRTPGFRKSTIDSALNKALQEAF